MQQFLNSKKAGRLEPRLVIGLMSGSSIDGIDAALVRISAQPGGTSAIIENHCLNVECLATVLYPFPEMVQKKLHALVEHKTATLEDLCKLNFLLGELFAQASIEVANVYGIDISKVDIIGSHGQTIYHISSTETEYNFPVRSTLQIGEPSIIAQRTGVTTIADFRPRDIAAGGEGAPLVCFADLVLFSDSKETRLVQNIGGIGNVTVIPHNAPPYAFDTGPGNALIDAIAKNIFNKDYDIDAKLAFSGHIDESWIDFVIDQEPYFKLKPPKSTGRELFNYEYLKNILDRYPIEKSEDIIASVSALTAKTIANAYKDFVLSKYTPSCTILGGGGVYNPFIVQHLNRYLDNSVPVKTHEDFGISNKFKEAIAFAILAYTTYYGIPNNVPTCTGSQNNVILGKIVPGNYYWQ